MQSVVRTVVGTVAVAVTTVTVAGCAQQVTGTARPALSGAAEPHHSYGYTDNRCGLLADGSVQDLLTADNVVRAYSGAVCQYVLSRQNTMLDVTFTWFDAGQLDRERAVAADRGAEISDTVIERRPAFLARRDATGAGCAATASAGGGVLSWWVQVRDSGKPSTADPCPDAEKLLAATLKTDM